MRVNGLDIDPAGANRFGPGQLEKRIPGKSMHPALLLTANLQAEPLPEELLTRYLASLQLWAAQERRAA